MSNFLVGLDILWDYYLLTALVVGIFLTLTYIICAVYDNSYVDTEDTLREAIYAIIAGLFGLTWALIVLAIPLIIVVLLLVLGKRFFYIKSGGYYIRRRNFKTENFIYRFIQRDTRTGVDNF